MHAKRFTGAVLAFLLVGLAATVSGQNDQKKDNQAITTNGQSVCLPVSAGGSGTVQLSGTWTGTITWKAATRAAVATTPYRVTNAGDGTTGTTTTGNGLWTFGAAGLGQFCAEATAAMTGTVTVDIRVSQGTGLVVGGAGGGDASAANQVTGNTSLASIDTKTPALVTGRQPVDGSGVTQPVSAASLPLPTGAATETTLAALNTKVPASPATDRATAAAPEAVRLSDGAAFYKATTPSDTQPVSGTVTANAGSGTFTTQQSNQTADYDTGAGTQNVTMFGVGLPAAGGAVAGGTATNPLRTDPTGSTTQPVSGTITANAGTGTFTVSGTVTGNQGTANTAANRWPTYVTDGTNTQPTMDAAARAGFVKVTDGTNTAAVKAASTAAQAADPAAVVALSPNSPIPTGSNTIGAVLGTKTNNNAAPGATNIGALTAVATAANPAYTEGNLATPSVDLSGRMRTMIPKTIGTCDLVMTSTANTCEVDVGDGVQGLSFSVEDTGSAWTGTVQFQTNSPNPAVWFFLAGFNISNGDGTNFTNDFDTCTTSLGASAPACNQNKNGTWLATGIGGIQKIRFKVQTAGTNTARVRWTTTGISDYVFSQTFGDLQQNDPAQVNGTTDGSFTGYAVWPLMQGGHGFSPGSFPQPALATLPAPATANNRRVTAAMTPYGETMVQSIDHHLICSGATAIDATGEQCAMPTMGAQGVLVRVSGTWNPGAAGLLSFQTSEDATTWRQAVGFNVETFTGAFDLSTGAVGVANANGTWLLLLANSAAYVRVVHSAGTWSSGAANVVIRATAAPPIQASLVFGDKATGAADASTAPVKGGFRVEADGSPLSTTGTDGLAVVEDDRSTMKGSEDGRLYVQTDHPNRFTCGADNIAGTLTELSTPCAAATISSTQSAYITDIIAQSTTATGGQFILRSGTGTNCGTATTSILPSAATVARLWAAGNGVAPTVINFTTPLKVTADHGICVLGVATNTVTIQVSGYVK